MGREVLAHCRLAGVEPKAFVDRQAERLDIVDGLRVIAPDAVEDADHSEIIVALHNPGVDVAAVVRELERRQFRHVHTLWSTCREDRWLPKSPFWIEPDFHWDAHVAAIGDARALFGDAKSIRVFDQQIELRRSGRYEELDRPTPDDQYAPTDLPRWGEPMRLLDVGAFDGDTVRSLRSAGYLLESVVALEPDPDNFASLEAAFAQSTNDRAICAGAASINGTLSFAAGEGGAAHLSTSGGSEVHVMRIDDVCADFHPTLVKMDIEGAEQDALDGAEQTLRRDRPDLAISVYHRIHDLWTIPLRLADRLGPFAFALRSHAFNGFDTVLYVRVQR